MKNTFLRVSYYRTDERTEAGEAVYELRFYAPNGKCQESKTVPASLLDEALEELRKHGILAKRVTL